MTNQTSLRDRAAEVTADAVEAAREFLDDTARPALHDAAAKAAPVIAAGAGLAAERAAHAAAQAKEYAEARSAELTGHPKQRRRGRKVLLLGLGLAAGAVIAALARRQLGGSSAWQSPAESVRPVGSVDVSSNGAVRPAAPTGATASRDAADAGDAGDQAGATKPGSAVDDRE